MFNKLFKTSVLIVKNQQQTYSWKSQGIIIFNGNGSYVENWKFRYLLNLNLIDRFEQKSNVKTFEKKIFFWKKIY